MASPSEASFQDTLRLRQNLYVRLILYSARNVRYILRLLSTDHLPALLLAYAFSAVTFLSVLRYPNYLIIPLSGDDPHPHSDFHQMSHQRNFQRYQPSVP